MTRALLLLLAATGIHAQNLRVGESLTYKLKYVGIPAVTITLSIPEKTTVDGREVYRLSAHARTSALFSAFYSLDNSYNTYVDAETGLPWKYTKSIAQKTLRQSVTTLYDQDSGKATYAGGKFDPPIQTALREQTHNFFSMIQRLRSLHLADGVAESFNLDVETEPWIASIRVQGTEELHVAGRHRNAHRVVFTFTPTQEETRRRKTDIVTRRVATSRSRLVFWIDAEPPHAFLQVEFELSPFSVYAVLVDEE